MAFLRSVLLIVVPLAVVASLVSVSASSAAWCRTRAADIIVFVVVSCRFHQLCSRHAVRRRCGNARGHRAADGLLYCERLIIDLKFSVKSVFCCFLKRANLIKMIIFEGAAGARLPRWPPV